MFVDDIALNGLAAERPEEFHMPTERLTRKIEPEHVAANWKKWGLGGEAAL
ncbi:MAG: hypothetical protein HRU17_14715 [Polyangiaceae bacterium]|nr:hypothetical protein [Polyangiaceae bacterium]